MPAQWHVTALVGSPLSLLYRQEPTFADISLQRFGVSLQRFGSYLTLPEHFGCRADGKVVDSPQSNVRRAIFHTFAVAHLLTVRHTGSYYLRVFTKCGSRCDSGAVAPL